MSNATDQRGVWYALAAAALFGVSTPFAKILTGEMPATMLAGLLYLGSGLGLGLCLLLRPKQTDGGNPLRAPDLPWLAGAILFGGIAGPLLLMAGLQRMPGSSASLLLNLEGVLTALLAWLVFRENFDRRILLGMALIVAAGVLLAFQPSVSLDLSHGALLVTGACACWAIDNNLTRKIAAGDALQIAALKGGVAGAVNLSIALALQQTLPAPTVALTAGAIGFAGYGLSLVLFVLALRHLGTARTGAYFSAAPFVGAVVSLLVLHESPDIYFWAAALLMAIGIVLHLMENHGHAHQHKLQSHAHPHEHDAHHRHGHEAGVSLDEPHTHAHQHRPLTHSHGHFPDIHHRHEH